MSTRQLGITSLIYHRRSFDRFLSTVAKQGYEAVEINLVLNYYQHFNALQLVTDTYQLARIREQTKSLNLEISAIDMHGFGWRNEPQKQFVLDYLHAGIDIARKLACPLLNTSCFPPRGKTNHQQYWEEVVQELKKVCDYASRQKVSICLEVEAGFLVGTSETLHRMLEEVGRENLAVNFDPSHFVRIEENVLEAIDRFYNHILHAHVKDTMEDRTPPRLDTDGPGIQAVRRLIQKGYEGTFSVELKADATMVYDPEQFSREAISILKAEIGKPR